MNYKNNKLVFCLQKISEVNFKKKDTCGGIKGRMKIKEILQFVRVRY